MPGSQNLPQLRMLEVGGLKPRAMRGGEPEEAPVLVLSHCILDRSTRWWQPGKSIAQNRGPVSQVIEFLSARNVGAVQLPCPEFSFFGNPRAPATKNEYESLPDFRSHCENLARDAAQQLKTLTAMACNPKIRILTVIGVERSPSCGVEFTPRTVNGETQYVKEKGLFIEFLKKKMRNQGLTMPFLGLDMRRPEESVKRLAHLLDNIRGE